MRESNPAASIPPNPVFLRLGHGLFRYRNALFPAVFLPLLVLSRPQPFLGDWRKDVILDVAGLVVAALGQTLRILVIGLDYIQRGGKDGRIHADDLVQGGLFAHSRNPLYLGNLLIVAGFLLVQNDPVAYLVAGTFFPIAYLAITAAEEDFLTHRFGEEYRAYVRRVPRFLPSLSGLATTMRSMRFDWRRVVRKEYGTVYVTSCLALAIIARELVIARPGIRWSAFVVPWAILTVLYLTARVLKKRRLLDDGR